MYLRASDDEPPRLSAFPAERKRGLKQLSWEAKACRKALGLDPLESLPSDEKRSLLNRLGRLSTRDLEVSYAVAELRPGVEAAAQGDRIGREIVIYLSPATYAGFEDSEPRARFTVVHEIGHAYLHPRELLRLSGIPQQKLDRALLRGEFSFSGSQLGQEPEGLEANTHCLLADVEQIRELFHLGLPIVPKGIESSGRHSTTNILFRH